MRSHPVVGFQTSSVHSMVVIGVFLSCVVRGPLYRVSRCLSAGAERAVVQEVFEAGGEAGAELGADAGGEGHEFGDEGCGSVLVHQVEVASTVGGLVDAALEEHCEERSVAAGGLDEAALWAGEEDGVGGVEGHGVAVVGPAGAGDVAAALAG